MSYSNVLRKAQQQRLLTDVTLELTYACNLDCFYCYNDREKPGKPLSLEQYKILLRDLAEMQTMYLMLSGGEPMVHPHFFAIGREANALGFVTRVRTNGHSLTRAMARRVRDEIEPYIVEISLHGATAEVHDKQTRVPSSFDHLIKNIKSAREEGLRMNAVTTPTAWNEHQINEMFALCDGLDIPLRFQGPVAPRDNGDLTPLEIQPTEASWQLISQQLDERKPQQAKATVGPGTAIQPKVKIELKNDEPAATCSVGVAGADIDPYGNVQACMHLQESAGNLHTQSIHDIWEHSPLFARARSRAVEAAKKFTDVPVKQMGAPIFCLAVEENSNIGCDTGCSTGCGR